MHKEKRRKMVHFGSMLSTQQNDVVRVPKRRKKKHSAKPLYLKIQSPKVNAREKLGPGFRF